MTRLVLSASILLAGFSGSLVAAEARAQSGSVPAQQLPAPAAPDSTASDVQTALDQGDTKTRFKEINKLTWKGWITPVPTYDDTIMGDKGGWRSELAKAGIGVTVWSLNNLSYDVADAGHRYPGQQLYNGQKFNAITSSQTAVLTYDLGKVGLDGGQLNVGMIATANGYQSRNGPRHVNVRHLYLYQPIADGRVELELGWITNQLDFIGIYVGGSLAGGTLGPQASLPVQAGMSFGSFSAPTASAKINWSKNLYTRTAIQRSLSPQGPAAERRNNSSGLEWSVPGAQPLLIQEIGYRTTAAPGQKSQWYRAGYMHNFSKYRSFEGGSGKENTVVYALADRQITQPDAQAPARGIYVGASFNAGRSEVNLIDRYYEGRVYVKGPLASRPSDMVSLVYGLNRYSTLARKAAQSDIAEPYSSTSAVTASYSYKIANGLYVQPGIGVTINPVYNRKIGTAVNGLLGISAFF